MLPPQMGQTLGIEHNTKLCRRCDYCKRHLLLRTNVLQMQNLLCVGEAGGPFSTPAFSSGRACLISQPAENAADRGLGTSVAMFCRCPLPAAHKGRDFRLSLDLHAHTGHSSGLCNVAPVSLSPNPSFPVPTRSWRLVGRRGRTLNPCLSHRVNFTCWRGREGVSGFEEPLFLKR